MAANVYDGTLPLYTLPSYTWQQLQWIPMLVRQSYLCVQRLCVWLQCNLRRFRVIAEGYCSVYEGSLHWTQVAAILAATTHNAIVHAMATYDDYEGCCRSHKWRHLMLVVSNFFKPSLWRRLNCFLCSHFLSKTFIRWKKVNLFNLFLNNSTQA